MMAGEAFHEGASMGKHLLNLAAKIAIVVVYFGLLLLAYHSRTPTNEINDEKYIKELETHFGPIPLPPKE